MIRVAEIQNAVAQHYGLTLADIRGPNRNKRVTQPRMVAMYLARRMTIRSYQELGNSFGGRDHTTVMSALKRIADLRARDPEIDHDIRAVLKLIPGAAPVNGGEYAGR